jgi:acyl-CoA synthetase (NDP forming)
VKLNINSVDEARSAFEGILDSCTKYNPDAVIDGVLVQEMAPQGLEVIIGIKNDNQFGPMMLVGIGGVFVEVFKDVSLYPCPINRNEALMMIGKLKGYKLFHGYRGSKPKDINALADMMVKLSDYAVANKDTLKEIDINPIFVYEQGDGVMAADALIVKNPDD